MLYILLSTYASIVLLLAFLVALFGEQSERMHPIKWILNLGIPFIIGILQCLVPLLTHLGVIK